MAMTNLTRDEHHKTYEQLLCSAEFTGGIHKELIFLSVLNIFLSITAFLGNTLILVALHKRTSLHPPSKLLFRSLATTDLCVGIILQPVVVVYWVSLMKEEWNICRNAFVAAYITSNILAGVSLFTLTAISVDRLLALLLRLRYRQVVTLKRTYLTVTLLWVVPIAGTAMRFLDDMITLWYSYITVLLCIVIAGFSYAKIFFTLRHHQIQVQTHAHQEQPIQTIPMNIARYRKTVSSALWVQMTLAVCYLPYGVVGAFISQRGLSASVSLARAFAVTLVYLNSSLNPILYCWKIREVRETVKDTIRHFCCT